MAVGLEEQLQAASVLLWDILPVQTNWPQASGLMGTRPAQGPNPLPPWPKLHRRTLQLKDALQLSQTDLKIFPVSLPSFPTQQRYMTFHVSTSALTFLTFEQPDSSHPYLSLQTHFLSLSHAFSITLPTHSIYSSLPSTWPRSLLMTFSLLIYSISLSLCNKLWFSETVSYDSIGHFPHIAAWLDLSRLMKVALTCGSGPEAPWRRGACSSPDEKVWMFSLWGFRVYQRMYSLSRCRLSLNVLFHKSMNIGTKSDGKREKALKTHRASTLTAHLLQRGLIVICPTDSGSHRHVLLPSCVWINLTGKHFNAPFCDSSFYPAILLCTRLCTRKLSKPGKCIICTCQNLWPSNDAKWLEVQQIYRGEWVVLSPVCLPHIWAQSCQCSLRQRSVMSCPELTVISHWPPPPTHTRTHTRTLIFAWSCMDLLGRFILFLWKCYGLSGTTYVFVLCMQVWPSPDAILWQCSDIL